MNKFKTFLISLIIALIISCGFVTGKSLFSILAFIVCGIVFLFVKTENMILILMFLLPFATIFKISANSTSLYTILELYAVVIYLFKKGKLLEKKFLLSFIFFFAYLLVIDFLHMNFSLINYLRIFVDFFLLYYFSNDFIICENKIDFLKNVIFFFSLGLLASSVLASFSEYIPNFSLFVREVGYNSKITNRFSGLNGDPNYYTINIIISLIGLLSLYSRKVINKSFWVMFFSLVFFGLQTYSKSFFLTFFISFILLILMLIANKNKKGLFWVLLFSIVAFFLLREDKIHNISLMMIRFNDAHDVNSLTTGRFNLWINYLKYILENINVLVFGKGIGSNYLTIGGVHNWYIEMLYYFGAIGTLLYLKCFAVIFSKVKSITEKKTLLRYSPFFILAILYFFLQMIFSNEIVFHIFLVYIIYAFLSLESETKKLEVVNA